MSAATSEPDDEARSLLILLMAGALFGLALIGVGAAIAFTRDPLPTLDGLTLPGGVELPEMPTPPTMPALPPVPGAGDGAQPPMEAASGSPVATSSGTASLEPADLEELIRQDQLALLLRIGAQDVPVDTVTCDRGLYVEVEQTWSCIVLMGGEEFVVVVEVLTVGPDLAATYSVDTVLPVVDTRPATVLFATYLENVGVWPVDNLRCANTRLVSMYLPGTLYCWANYGEEFASGTVAVRDHVGGIELGDVLLPVSFYTLQPTP